MVHPERRREKFQLCFFWGGVSRFLHLPCGTGPRCFRPSHRVCVQVRCVCVSHSDSALNGPWSHMVTCQQAGGGHLIRRREAAVISLCVLCEAGGLWREPALVSNSALSLCLSLSLCLCPFISDLRSDQPGVSPHSRVHTITTMSAVASLQ